MNIDIIGHGGGGGGKGGGGVLTSAKEAPDSLRSRAYARVIDLISEGEIEGLVNGAKSIYLDETPIENPDGSKNFTDVSVYTRNGTQAQDYIPGFASVENTVSVATQVKASAPVTRQFTNPNLNAIQVTLAVPRLTNQNTSNGDLNGTSVQIKIEVQSAGGGFISVPLNGREIIEGKTTSRYQRTYRVPLTGSAPWDVRVTRLTADSTSSALSNETWWDTATEVIDAKLRYPNSALVAMSIEASQFSSVPKRAYDVKLLRVRVPANYDPVARTYSGSWNGTFKVAWTDNPAWCFYDLVTSKRYGLGEFVNAAQVDKWSLYTIGKYCDELVPDGKGGTEPRFTCNIYLQSKEDAYKVVADFASIFRGMTYWSAGAIVATQDAPSDPVALYTAANVIDSIFTYQGSSAKARHTVALVTWNDMSDFGRQKVEYVEDAEGIARYGVVTTEVAAIGCTSRGQAHRAGKWILYSERLETETVTFQVGLEGMIGRPGQVVRVADPARAGVRLGGRLTGTPAANAVTLDAPVTLVDGVTYTLTVMKSDGTLQNSVISNTAGTSASITLATALPEAPEAGSIWMITSSALDAQYFRVIAIKEDDSHSKFTITGVAHNPGKFGLVETGVLLESPPTSMIPTRPGQVTEITSSTQLYSINDNVQSARIALSWRQPVGAIQYTVEWQRDSENFKTATARSISYDIDNVPSGVYTIRITPINAVGISGDPVTITHTVLASGVAPDVTSLELNPSFSGKDLPLKWAAVAGATGYQIEVRDDSTSALLRAEAVSGLEYVYTYAKNVQDGGPRRSVRFRVRAKTLLGVSANWTAQTFSNNAPATPQGIVSEAGPGQVTIMAQRPTDDDLVGMIVWMHTNSSVPTTDAYKVYQGTDNAFTKTQLTAGVPMYFKIAFYDAFGAAGLNVSTSISATPTAAGGILTVTTLPANPAAVGGQLALFLNSEDVNLRGLYGWDGSAWVGVKGLLDGSVTSAKLANNAVLAQHILAGAVSAEKMNVTDLSAISANLGTMTAGNFTLNATGFIKGGAANFASGAGFWMGQDGGAYKFRVGQPGSSRMEWNGTAFNIYDSAGNITISSGVVDYARVSGKPTSLSAISASEATKLSGIQVGATANQSDSVTNAAILATRKNLANIDWWKEGASIPWPLNAELNQLRHTSQVPGTPAGPRGVADIVWYCEETSGNGESGGGWDAVGNSFVSTLDKNKCYRFVVPIYRVSGGGHSYWGIENVATLNTNTSVGNPYFCARSLPVGKWFLFVGYVYPAGTTNATSAGSGIYDCETGALVQAGTSYNFLSSGADSVYHRAYQFYSSAGASQIFGRPLVECVDGTESSLREYFSASATLNSAISMGADGTLSGGSGGKVTLPGMGVNTFRILTRGNSSTQHPAGDLGLYKNGVIQSGVGRSYVVGKINRTTGDYVQVGSYDVYGGAGDAAAAALNAIGNDSIVVVYSFDEPQNGRNAAFLNAMYRHGASRAVLGSPNFRYRSVYVLVGIGGCGEGNGAEIYQGAIDSDPAAWIDMGFSVNNGVLTGVSSATTPKSLSDYGYVGALNATANQSDSVTNAGIASAATTASWSGVTGTGKPQDNATVGATIGTNLSGQITAANASTYIANAAIGSAQIGSIALVGTSNFSVKTGTTGARMEMDSRTIKVYDANGILRVQLGDLTA